LLEIGSGARGREVERAADVATARQLIGFSARVPLSEGLGRTIAWYRERLEQGRL
jgi:nucleoside-diphosphate-sugar epimerase